MFVYLTLILATISNGMFTAWTTIMLPSFMSSKTPYKMEVDQISWVMSMHLLGSVISPIPAGILMDSFGRKSVLVWSGFILTLTSLVLTIFNGGCWQLLLTARFLSGLWYGIVSTIAPMYIAEIAEPNQRGQLLTQNQISLRLGNLFSLVISLFLSYKVFLGLLSTTIILFLILCPFIPESPYFYVKKNDLGAARQALSWIRNSSDNDEEILQLDIAVKKQTENQISFVDAISKRSNIRSILILQILSILSKLAGIGSIISYLMISLPGVKNLDPTVFIIIIESFRLTSGFVTSMIIDKIKNIVLLTITSLICGVAMMITSFWYYIDYWNSIASESFTMYMTQTLWWIPFICITLHGISYSLGVTPVCNKIRSEYFPISIKGKCSALTCTTLAFTSFAVNKTYLMTSELFGLYFNFAVYGLSAFLITVVASWFLIESKGKTLQEIQDDLESIETGKK